MTLPYAAAEDEMDVIVSPHPAGTIRSEEVEPVAPKPGTKPYPKPILDIGEEKMKEFVHWLDTWITDLRNAREPKLAEWADEEEAYQATPEAPKTEPYVGACNLVVPAIAMAVDPVFARIDSGVFKQEPVFRLTALRKSWQPRMPGFEAFVEFYQKNKLKLRRHMGPCILDIVKHGTGIISTEYDCEKYEIATYDDDWKVVKKKFTRFEGPRIRHVPIQNFLFPPHYQHLEHCPIVVEEIYTTKDRLRIMEKSGKLIRVKKIEDDSNSQNRTELDDEQATSANHEDPNLFLNEVRIERFQCKYDIDGDGITESLIGTYHSDSGTILELRYNWYFHQRYTYTVIPYMLRSGSLYGYGICAMVKPFQDLLTSWEQNALDNSYLANIRMFVSQKNSGIEDQPKLFTGRVFRVDNPQTDFREFKISDTYGSTLNERQNLFGLAEKRTGISDYLTGRESPIVGSRATATSTMALIQEGTKRVESMLDNLREGLAEAIEKCIHIWIQYGTGNLEDIAFGMDSVADDVKAIFDNMRDADVNSAIAIGLSVTDSGNNRMVQQQTQLAIIQTMMQYLQKVVELAMTASQSMQTNPALAEFLGEVATSARKMFKELLDKYDIRNADEFLPDLEAFLAKLSGAAGAGPGSTGIVNDGAGGQPSVSAAPQGVPGAAPGSQQPAGVGYGGVPGVSPAG